MIFNKTNSLYPIARQLLPEDSLSLPGCEDADLERRAAAGIAEAERLSAAMRETRDISAKSGKIERDSPLFFSTGENPSLF